MEPELRKAREFAQSQPYPVFLCDYHDHVVSAPQWDEERRLVKVNRTETCNATHALVSSSGLLILPRRSEELEIFAKQAAISPRFWKRIRKQDRGSIATVSWERITTGML